GQPAVAVAHDEVGAGRSDPAFVPADALAQLGAEAEVLARLEANRAAELEAEADLRQIGADVLGGPRILEIGDRGEREAAAAHEIDTEAVVGRLEPERRVAAGDIEVDHRARLQVVGAGMPRRHLAAGRDAVAPRLLAGRIILRGGGERAGESEGAGNQRGTARKG